MRPFRFVHAADIHLDSPFKGITKGMSESNAKRVRESTFDAFHDIISLCITEKVDALLIAGDVYDGADRSFKAQIRFISELKRLSDNGIRSYVCHGNHDPLDGWQSRLDFPEHSYRFSSEAQSFSLFEDSPEEVKIHGISYPTREIRKSLVPKFAGLKKGEFNIGLLHANVGGDINHESYAPCSVSDLMETEYDYWALGHVHNKKVLKTHSPTIVYPGNPQARHINEDGPRGIYLVDVDEAKNVRLEFKEIDLIRWEKIEINVHDVETEQVLIDRLKDALDALLQESQGRSLVIRIMLKGQSPIHLAISREGFAEELRDHINEEYEQVHQFIWCDKIQVSTWPSINRKERSQGNDFIAEMLKLTDKFATDEASIDKLIEEVASIYNIGKVGKYSKQFTPNREDVKEILKEAESLYLTGLLGREEE